MATLTQSRDPVDDVHVVIRAHYAAPCAGCGLPYEAGSAIGHSREADGWVAQCCAPGLRLP